VHGLLRLGSLMNLWRVVSPVVVVVVVVVLTRVVCIWQELRGRISVVIWRVEAGLNQLFAFSQGNHRLKFRSGERINVPRLRGDEDQGLRAGQRGKFVCLFHQTSLTPTERYLSPALVLDELDLNSSSPRATSLFLYLGLGFIGLWLEGFLSGLLHTAVIVLIFIIGLSVEVRVVCHQQRATVRRLCFHAGVILHADNR